MYFFKVDSVNKDKGTLNLPEILILLSGFVGLAVVLFIFDRPPFYDEDDYLQNVVLIHKFGFGKQYLMHHIGSAGPLYPVIHYFLEPVTLLKSPNIRLVNIVFLAGVTFFISRSLLMLKFSDGRLSLTIMAIPMTYVVSGLALTEMPAMFFFTAGIYMIIKALAENTPYWSAAIMCVVAGICLSLAIVGRQPYLLTLAALPVLFYNRKELKRNAGLLTFTILFSVMLPCYIFFTWKGLVAPYDASIYAVIESQGILYRPDFFWLCLAYYALVFVLIAPGFYIIPPKRGILLLLLLFIVIAALNHEFEFVRFLPFKPFLIKLVPLSTQIAAVEKLAGSTLAMIGIYFLYVLAQQLHRSGYRKELLFYALAILAIAVSCVKLTCGFSSRYAAQAIPMLIPFASFFYKRGSKNTVLFAIGTILGVMSLIGFFLNEQ